MAKAKNENKLFAENNDIVAEIDEIMALLKVAQKKGLWPQSSQSKRAQTFKIKMATRRLIHLDNRMRLGLGRKFP